jgi:hypothetical protein
MGVEAENAKTKLLPATDGFGPYQAGVVALGVVAHAKRIAVGKVARDIPVIGNGDVGAFLAQADVEAVIFVAMREQTDSGLLTARDDREHHGNASERLTWTGGTANMRVCLEWRKIAGERNCGNDEEDWASMWRKGRRPDADLAVGGGQLDGFRSL